MCAASLGSCDGPLLSFLAGSTGHCLCFDGHSNILQRDNSSWLWAADTLVIHLYIMTHPVKLYDVAMYFAAGGLHVR